MMKRFSLFLLIALSVSISSSYAQSIEHTQHSIEMPAELPVEQMETPSVLPDHLPQKGNEHFSLEELKNDQASPEDHFMRDFINMLFSLGLIVALIFIASWFLKRMMNTRLQQINESSEIKIIDRRSITPKTIVYLLEVKGKGLVVGESTHGLSLLSTYETESSEES